VPVTEVSLTLEDGLICQVFTSSHIITADDPPDPDQEDEGPDPLEYLLTAIGSSAAIAVKTTALKLRIDVEEIQVSVKWPAGHRKLLDTGDTLPAIAIRREIRLRAARDITETERDQLLEAAKSCPVDRCLGGTPRVEDALYIFGYESDLDTAAEPDSGE
jgi:putative redox protein